MKALSQWLFSATYPSVTPTLTASYERVSASDLGLPESWFRDAIYGNPDLVIAPCREANRVMGDEVWFPWNTEVNFGAGPVDVLLVSSHGRPAIVETKLSYNPQKRREVVAQILDYALSLQETPHDALPPLPDIDGSPDPTDFFDCLAAGRFLLIVAGDMLDSRAIRLSEELLARNLTSEWDLAMVDLNVYRSIDFPSQLLIAPELRGILMAETRQVVRVQVEGETPRARVFVERLPSENEVVARRPRISSYEEFLQRVNTHVPNTANAVARVLDHLRAVADRSEGRFVLGLQSASANLYWCPTVGTQRRIFGLGDNGRFRIWLSYLRGEGRHDLAYAVQERAKSIITVGDNEQSGAIDLNESNSNAVIRAIDSVIETIRQNA